MLGTQRVVLEMHDIRKSFGAVHALKGTRLSMAPGEIRALLGANGSGKSTMVKILGGMVRMDSGSITLDGRPLHIASPRSSREAGIAVAYQDLSLIPRLSVADCIALGHEPRGLLGFADRGQARRTASELIERLEIAARPEDLVIDLDSSTLSLVEIAKAVAVRPRMLLLDEVTASLHRDQVERLFALLRELRDGGTGILFVSHRLEEVFALCDRATILRSGETVAEVSLAASTEGEIVYEMTGKRIEEESPVPGSLSRETREPILRVTGLVVPPRVQGIDLVARAGEIIGIGGLVGQGQAEFLRALYGARIADEGRIEYRGRSVRFRSPAEAVRQGFGFIPGDREREGVFHVRPVTENLHLARIAQRPIASLVDPSVLHDEAVRIVDELKIVVGDPLQPASSLSGGNQQKVVIGRWLQLKPSVLILDDPTKGVDITSRHEIHELLRRMAASGTTILLSSSENEELLAVSDRILVFYEGRVIEELSGHRLTEERLAQAMLGVAGGNGGATGAERFP